MMRKVQDRQMMLGEVDISQIKFDGKSRDEIPQLLRGLQYIYCTPELKDKVFSLLEGHMAVARTGRRGMDLWKILVLGVIRLNCDWNYDKLKEMADNHLTLRGMLGHSLDCMKSPQYPLQTLKDNVGLLTPELLDAINVLVVQSGQSLVKKKDDVLRARGDSFVVETNVHYPTDINLLFDATRKTVEITSGLCEELGIPGWRQSAHQMGVLKKCFRICQKSKRSMSKDPQKQERKMETDRQLHRDYMNKAGELLGRAEESLVLIVKSGCDDLTLLKMAPAEMYLRDGVHQIDLINRRVLGGEKIPHEEKIFSLFERHTEWISKGKAGVPQELGKRICIVEDKYGFVLSHMLMNKIGDKEAVVPFIEKVKKLFPELYSCSFDKGFWSSDNKENLEEIISVALPRPGRLSKDAKEYQSSTAFIEARKKHSAVESCINALENHGLGRCPDRGIKNFERYISLAVLARNIQKLGTVLIEKEKKSRMRSEKIKEGLMRKKFASAA